jgi:iron complex outermembrane receptor protein
MNPRLLTMCIAGVAQIATLWQVAAAAPLDEMITRAERRERDLQEVPVAVSTFDSADIDRRQITGTLDLIQNVPNLHGSHNVSLGGSNSFFLRGIGNAESIATFDVPVGTYIDEIYISRQNQNQVRMFDIERLEVLRGPQGTLFGRNTTGGAITVALKRPSDETEAEIEGSAGNYERYWLRGKIGGAITDTFFGSVAGFVVDEDGWMDSVTTGDTYNGEEAVGARAAIRWVPSDAFAWDVSLQYSDTKLQAIGSAAFPVASQTYETGDATKNQTALRDCDNGNGAPSATNAPVCSFNQMESTLLSSNIEWDLGPVTINFITGWYELDQEFSADFLDNSQAQPFGPFFGDTFIIANDGNHEQVSQEIKFTGDAANGRFNYVGGLFYMDEENTTAFTDWIGTKPNLLALNVRTPLENSTESIAAYGQVDFAVTDKLTLIGGGRWTDEEKDLSLSGSLSFAPVDNSDLVAAGIPLEQSVDKFTYRLGGQFQFSDDVMGFVTYTTGFKSGGWNARGNAPLEFQPFSEEEVSSIEGGIRSEFIDNRVRLNVTLFRAEYDDVQIATVFPGSTIFLTLNAGDTRVQGAEIETQIQATNNIRLFGNVGLMDAKYTRLSSAAVNSNIGPAPVRTPDASVTAGFEWNAPNGIFAGAMASWEDDYFMGNSNQPETLIKDHLLINAQVGWRSDNDRWEIVGECKNCTDKSWFGTNLFNLLYTADPVRWNVRLKYSL